MNGLGERGEDGRGPDDGAGGEGLDARRDRLDRRLDALRRAEEAVAAREGERANGGYVLAVKLGSEFVSAVIVGLAIGWGLDWLLGTTPWLMVVFLLLGFAAGVLNVLRSAGLISAPQPGNRPPENGAPRPHAGGPRHRDDGSSDPRHRQE